MKTIRKISLLVVLALGALVSIGIAEAAPTTSAAKRTRAYDAFVARATRFLHFSRALESDSLFSSMPRISWGQIKAKYRNPDDPKGS